MITAIALALGYSILKGTEKVLNRYVLANHDSLSYAFIWHILGSIFLIPFFILEFNIPTQPIAWILLITSAILWSSVAYLGFKAYTLLEVSLKAPIGKSKMLFVLALAIIFLNESLTTNKVVGTIIIFAGILVLTFKKRKKFGSFKNKGVLYALLSAFIMAVALLVDKSATVYFNTGMYSFLVYFLPIIILLPFVTKKKTQIKHILKKNFFATCITALLSTFSYYLIIKAFSLAEASVILPFAELSTLFAVLGGIIFLKERTHMKRKIIGSVIITAGVLILAGVI